MEIGVTLTLIDFSLHLSEDEKNEFIRTLSDIEMINMANRDSKIIDSNLF